MANHRGVSRCQWLCVAVGTPRKTMGLNRLSSLGESSHRAADWAAQPSEQGWGGLDWGHWRIRTGGGVQKATTEGNSSEDGIGPRAGHCSPRLWLVLRQPVWSTRPDHRTNGPPLLIRHRRFVCAIPQPISVGWLAAPYPRLALPYLIQSPRETEDPMGCPCESWAGSGKCGEMGVGR